jgi:hypothetical protein
VTLALLCVVLLATGTVFILFSRRQLAGSDDAELAGWCVIFGLGLSGAAAFIAEAILFPKPKSADPPLRFAILHHQGIDEPHFDLMLETSPGSELATWRSPVWPITQPTELRQLANHRQEYLNYEGEIAGGRGTVRQVASGTYQISDQADGGKLIRWDQPSITPMSLRRIEETRWLASPAISAN